MASPPALPDPRRRFGGAADFAATLLLGAYALLKTYALGASLSDEYIYLYMCRRIAEGAIPYADFFFAHPPLHLLPGTLLLALFGFSLPLAKVVPAVAGAVAGIAVYRVARRAGPLQGIVALALFLFSYDLLRASSHYTGATEAAALLAWGLERALAGRPMASGALAAAAALVAFYAAPAAAALGLVLFLRRDGAAALYGAAWAAVFGGANLACLAAFGGRYWDPVFRYHFLKPPAGDGSSAALMRAFVADNNWLIGCAAAAAAAIFLVRRVPQGTTPRSRYDSGSAGHVPPDDPWWPAAAGVLMAASHLVFLSASGRLFTYYFVPAFPGLAIAGGVASIAILDGARRAARTPRGGAWARSAAFAFAAAVLCLAGPQALRLAAGQAAGEPPERGTANPVVWRDAPLPASLNVAVRALLWREDGRAGALTPAVTRYLQHESLRFEAPAYFAWRVRDLTPPGSTLFGDSLTAPLVALLADRRIALDEADTNYMRYASGITHPDRTITALEQAPPEAIIASPLRGFFLVPEMRRWVTSHYRLAETFQDPLYGAHLLYLRVPQR